MGIVLMTGGIMVAPQVLHLQYTKELPKVPNKAVERSQLPEDAREVLERNINHPTRELTRGERDDLIRIESGIAKGDFDPLKELSNKLREDEISHRGRSIVLLSALQRDLSRAGISLTTDEKSNAHLYISKIDSDNKPSPELRIEPQSKELSFSHGMSLEAVKIILSNTFKSGLLKQSRNEVSELFVMALRGKQFTQPSWKYKEAINFLSGISEGKITSPHKSLHVDGDEKRILLPDGSHALLYDGVKEAYVDGKHGYLLKCDVAQLHPRLAAEKIGTTFFLTKDAQGSLILENYDVPITIMFDKSGRIIKKDSMIESLITPYGKSSMNYTRLIGHAERIEQSPDALSSSKNPQQAKYSIDGKFVFEVDKKGLIQLLELQGAGNTHYSFKMYDDKNFSLVTRGNGYITSIDRFNADHVKIEAFDGDLYEEISFDNGVSVTTQKGKFIKQISFPTGDGTYIHIWNSSDVLSPGKHTIFYSIDTEKHHPRTMNGDPLEK